MGIAWAQYTQAENLRSMGHGLLRYLKHGNGMMATNSAQTASVAAPTADHAQVKSP